MHLSALFRDGPPVTFFGSAETEIEGLQIDSRKVSPGDLFIALPGHTSHGRVFIADAVDRGATAVLADGYDPHYEKVTQIVHHRPIDLLGSLADRWYGYPSHDLFLVGVTGTNGKTTTTHIVHSLCEALIGPCGMIGTIGYKIGEQAVSASHTTPDAITNHCLMHRMREHKCVAAVMEVSSHALVQHRVDSLDFDVALFTNLSQEHLDYHKTMERYAQAKAQLFGKLVGEGKRAILNRDDPWHKVMSGLCQVPELTYGLSDQAEVWASDIVFFPEKTRFCVHHGQEVEEVFLPLPGLFNVYNALGAIALFLSRGFSLEEIAFPLQTIPSVPGRMQWVSNAKGKKVFIDYAHTPDALENALLALEKIPHRHILTLFGCGGDRDPRKRPRMAAIAEKYSLRCFVTNDNPRSEDPEKIAQEIVRGFDFPERHEVWLDRKEAIGRALQVMGQEDLLLIAGKGHERGQIFARQILPFDDKEVVQEWIDRL